MATLKVITTDLTPAAEVKRRMRRHPKPAGMIRCHKCGGGEVLETRSNVVFEGGKTKRGTKILICAMCFMRGERVALL